ncbi:MAG: nuclear transport factor 2 family protein [Thermoleophilaceae bacterium]
MSDENVHAIQAGYAAFERNDLDAVLSLLDRKIRWREPKVKGIWAAGRRRGRKTVAREVLGPIPTLFEEFKVETDAFIDAGKHVVVTGNYRIRGRGHNLDIVTPFAHVWRVKRGRAKSFRNYTETARWRTTLEDVPALAQVG